MDMSDSMVVIGCWDAPRVRVFRAATNYSMRASAAWALWNPQCGFHSVDWIHKSWALSVRMLGSDHVMSVSEDGGAVAQGCSARAASVLPALHPGAPRRFRRAGQVLRLGRDTLRAPRRCQPPAGVRRRCVPAASVNHSVRAQQGPSMHKPRGAWAVLSHRLYDHVGDLEDEPPDLRERKRQRRRKLILKMPRVSAQNLVHGAVHCERTVVRDHTL